jgi:hypothetical protein
MKTRISGGHNSFIRTHSYTFAQDLTPYERQAYKISCRALQGAQQRCLFVHSSILTYTEQSCNTYKARAALRMMRIVNCNATAARTASFLMKHAVNGGRQTMTLKTNVKLRPIKRWPYDEFRAMQSTHQMASTVQIYRAGYLVKSPSAIHASLYQRRRHRTKSSAQLQLQ